MAALTYTVAAQTLIAETLLFKPYASLTSDEKILIDGNTAAPSATPGGWAGQAMTWIQQLAQPFAQAGATSAPDVWEPVLIAYVCAKVSITLRRDASIVRSHFMERELAIEAALSSFTLDSYTSATLAGQSLTMQGILFYVLDKLVRMKPRRQGSTAGIMAETQYVLNWCWNNDVWELRRRQVRGTVTPYIFSGATWTESSKTLTLAAGFSTTIAAGDRVRIDDVESVMPGDYIAASGTANTVVLTTSLSIAGTDISGDGVSGAVTKVRLVGMGSGESFDSIASAEWRYDDGEGSNLRLFWADADRMAMGKALSFPSLETEDRPRTFRIENRSAYKVWHFYPEPDQAYSFRGEVYVDGPGTPSSATDATVFAKFLPKMLPHMRDLVLARVLKRIPGAGGAELWAEAVQEINHGFGIYEDPGAPNDRPEPTDVYRDIESLPGGLDAWGSSSLGGIM